MQVTYLEAFLRVTDFVPTGPNSFRLWLTRIAENNLRHYSRALPLLVRATEMPEAIFRDWDARFRAGYAGNDRGDAAPTPAQCPRARA